MRLASRWWARSGMIRRVLFRTSRRPPRPPLFPYTTLFRSGRPRTIGLGGKRIGRGRGVDGQRGGVGNAPTTADARSEEHTSELQSRGHLVCRLLLEKKNLPIVPSLARAAPERRVPCVPWML